MQIDFNILWRYFSWANQATAVIALWIATMYLFVKCEKYIISLSLAVFMTYMVLVYILNAQIGFKLDLNISRCISSHCGKSQPDKLNNNQRQQITEI